MGYKTLREECYYKTGRKGVVLECIDMMRPNLFDNNRNINNSIFHNGSKFRFTIVDSRKAKDKGKALYYNLDPNEVLLLTYLLSDGIASSFKKRAGAFNELPGAEQNYVRELVETFDSIDFNRFDRAMDYSKKKDANMVMFQKNINIGGNNLLVRKLIISFEEAMSSSSKWKITIETGEAQKDDKGNGLNIIKYGTYNTTDKSYLMLQANEVVTPINEASKRVVLSQGIFYSQMKDAELDFTKRKMEVEDYEGDKIDEWNPQGKAIPRKQTQPADVKAKVGNKPVNTTPSSEEKSFECKDCGAKIDTRINDYSTKVHKRPLCFNCQKKEKEKQGK